ncbi:MAG: MFS transporter [Simkania sp.]|nr:MFS transporter [Simkania sp.]
MKESKLATSSNDLHPHPYKFYPLIGWVFSIVFIFFIIFAQSSIWYANSPLFSHEVSKGFTFEKVFDPILLVTIFLQLPVALFMDTFGLSKVITYVMMLTGFGILWHGLADVDTVNWVSLGLVGLGWTVTYTTSLKMVSNWFSPKYFSVMVGVTVCLAALGSLAGQLFNHHLFSIYTDKSILINYGLAGIIYSMIFFSFINNTKPGIKYENFSSKLSFKQVVKQALSSKENWYIALFFGLVQGTRISIYGLEIPIFVKLLHISDHSGIIINVYNFMLYAIGLIIFGWVSMYYKSRKTLMIGGTVISLICFLVPMCLHTMPVMVNQVLLGISSFFCGVVFLAFVMIHERNVFQITATVVGMLVFTKTLFHFITGWIMRFVVGPLYLGEQHRLHCMSLITILVIANVLGILFLCMTKKSSDCCIKT